MSRLTDLSVAASIGALVGAGVGIVCGFVAALVIVPSWVWRGR